MYCICCKKDNVIPNTKYSDVSITEEEELWKKESREIDGHTMPININNSMVDGGIIHIIDAGYGSNYDTSRFIIAICDDCIKENIEDATLLYYGNYMLSELDEKNVNFSKMKFHRRKNLDNITN